MEITLLDIVFGSILFVSAFLGFFKGSIGVILSILTFIGGIFSANYIKIFVINVLKEYIVDHTTINLLSYFLAFMFGYAIISILCSPILNSLSVFSNSILNKIFGIPAGLLKATLINGIILALLLGPVIYSIEEKDFNNKMPKWIYNSITFHYVKNYIPYNKIKLIAKEYLQSKEEKEQDDLEKTIFELQ
ncbi:MAG: CvpA family protein [Rickettsiales bacterium]